MKALGESPLAQKALQGPEQRSVWELGGRWHAKPGRPPDA